MKKFKSRELKAKNRCKFHRSHDLHLETGKKAENVYTKASIIKEQIKTAIYSGIFDEKTTWDIIKDKFLNLGYPTEETAIRQALDALFQIKRYVTSELDYLKSKDRNLAFNPGKRIMNLKGYCEVEVIPDFIFRGEKEFERTVILPNGKKKKEKIILPYIEVVKLCCSKPTVSQRGHTQDCGAETSLELYAMLCYARSLCTEKDKGCVLIASYYFLRSNVDNKMVCENFFDIPRGGNIVSLEETNDYFGFNSVEMDKLFIPQLEEFLSGSDTCGKDICEKCEYYKFCNYTKPPKYLKTEKKVKELSDLSLTDQQEAAIGFRKGIARINAGAGAGKTLVTTLRVAFMLEEGIDPKDICMLTFSISGTEEMRERIRLYVEDMGVDANVNDLTCMTFNSFGNEIIQKHYAMFGFTEPPTIIDDIEKFSIVEKILREHCIPDLDYKNFRMNFPFVKGALHVGAKAFEIIKRESLSIGDEEKLNSLMKEAGYPVNSISALTSLIDLYPLYDEALKTNNLIEYADQELMLLQLLDDNPFYFEDKGYRHIIVDEFQDTSPIQFKILTYLIDTPDFESFMVVGDDSQSIYSFRGSDPQLLIHFFDNLEKDGKDFYLLENHRSTPEIIDFANKLNALNINRVEKDLIATRPSGAPVKVKQFWKGADKNEEFNYIIDSIINLHEERKVDYEDIAFIAFSRDTLLKMGTLCTERGIPWVLLNPEPMLENSRVSACIALAKFMMDNSATMDAFEYLNAVSKNTIFSTKTDAEILTDIETLAMESQMILSMNDLDGFKKKVEALDDDDELFDSFVKTIFQKGNLENILEYCCNYAIYGDQQKIRRERDYPGVVLTTAHSSKGMEWNYVFNSITDYHTKRLQSNYVEERRRLLFVSATRARDELTITGQSVAFGKKDDYTYNRFLIDAFHCIGKEFSYDNPYDKPKVTIKTRKTRR